MGVGAGAENSQEKNDANHFFKASVSKIFLQYLPVASPRKIIPLVPQFPIFRIKEKLLQRTVETLKNGIYNSI